MKFGTLYELDTFRDPRRWKYYIFINNKEMFVFDKEFKEFRHEDKLDMNLIDEENYDELDSNLLEVDTKKFIIKSVL